MLTFDAVELRLGDFALAADFAVPPGLTAVIGPSGGGKSTLLSAVAGFVAPVRGRVTWEGRDLGPLDPGARPVASLFQDNNLFPHLTVAQNVGLALGPKVRLSGAEAERVAATLARVGLEGLGDRKPASLSGGQQSRAALARVLLTDRPVVLLDEAFAALGPALRQEMLGLVSETLVSAGRTVLMVTHDPADAEGWSDRLVLVADGRAVMAGDTAQVLADPPETLRAYLGS